jgi:hypothetical protein
VRRPLAASWLSRGRGPGRRRVWLWWTASVGTAVAWPLPAGAHAGGSGFILLLPTHLYVVGGVLVVTASFGLVALVPARVFDRAQGWRITLGSVDPGRCRPLSTAASLVALAAVAVLVVAGTVGSRDPLANPLPLMVWAVWWIGFTYLHAAAGDLWAHVNPWSGLYRVVTGAGPLRRLREAPPLEYPARAGVWPAVAGFAAFAWFELVYPAPADPAVLALVVAAYLVVHFGGVFLFGDAWLRHAEVFAVFFRAISRLAPVGADPPAASRPAAGGRRAVTLALPALRLLGADVAGVSGAAFLLLVLSSVSFDGLSRTFAWLALLGVNPLVHPGRTALVAQNSLGLVVLVGLLAVAYGTAVRLAARLSGLRASPRRLVAAFAPSLVPIACGYHFAHYLPVLLVDGQYALRAASDPFARGWDLLGLRDLAVVTSLVTDPARLYVIWHAQVGIIVLAHVAGIFLAHALALRVTGGRAATTWSQLPMLVLMMGYTLLGLWLLSTPAVG